VYAVVEPGLTEIEDVVAPPGDHENVPPEIDGVAVSVAVPPAQIVVLFTETVGVGLTVTTVVMGAPEHPAAVPVIVYVAVPGTAPVVESVCEIPAIPDDAPVTPDWLTV
jgi:hypothetical protein